MDLTFFTNVYYMQIIILFVTATHRMLQHSVVTVKHHMQAAALMPWGLIVAANLGLLSRKQQLLQSSREDHSSRCNHSHQGSHSNFISNLSSKPLY
jgi:hypothetical protein